ncbi:hypothetical protein KSS88_18435 [Bacillus altitudinis]|nr:hypothetical protein [Bacillus altitudinis]MBU8970825.1 hypothetical protein [Bacillus altitudinis]
MFILKLIGLVLAMPFALVCYASILITFLSGAAAALLTGGAITINGKKVN